MAKQPTAKKRSHKGLIAAITTVVCLTLAFAITYPVAQDYYIAMRTNDKLEAELAAITARNETIAAQIEELKTQEGIEDRAREEFGWVHEGEKAVNITGLDIENSTTVMPASIQAGSIAADTAWINSVLDMVFNFDVNAVVPKESVTDPIEVL
jgi:cell division protein FtsB